MLFRYCLIIFWFQSLPVDVKELINLCLNTDPCLRPTPAQLLKHDVFTHEFEPEVTSPTTIVDLRRVSFQFSSTVLHL